MKPKTMFYIFCAFYGWMIGLTISLVLDEQNEPEPKAVSQQECCVETPQYQLLIIEPDNLEEESYYDSLELLAICVEAEAGNQPLDGRRMVADVILNRVDNPDFPDTIEGVISQPYHFSSYWDGGMDKVTEPSELTIKAVRMELQERGYPGLLYFKEGGYSTYGTPYKKIGDHYFSL